MINPIKLVSFFFKKTVMNPFLVKGKRMDEYSTKAQYLLHRYKIDRKKKQLLKKYNNNVDVVDYTKPYVYFPLHAQPEPSTNPLGGHYEQQNLIADMLDKTLPDDWYLYIKEHKVQYDLQKSKLLPRKDDFYRQLKNNKRVKFLDINTSPFSIIDNCKVVATVSGDTGWEAVNRGKPVLLFGYAWYYGCEGIFDARNYDGCIKAIKTIQNGYTPNPNMIRLFAKAVQDVGMKAYIYETYGEAYNISETQTVEEIYNSIKNIINNNHRS